MILREEVILKLAGTVEYPTYAELRPLKTSETFELQRSPESISYRAILGPLDPAYTPHASDYVEWRGSDYEIIGPAMKYTVNNKLHHLELNITRTTG